MSKVNYKELNLIAKSLIGYKYKESILANASAMLKDNLVNTNWTGFYLNKDNMLYLAAFQGHPACIEIPFTKGVCGACATSKEITRVDNVHEFKGHIACDSASNSEIVLPIILNNELYGLLDIDSPSLSNFDKEDEIGLKEFVGILQEALSKAI